MDFADRGAARALVGYTLVKLTGRVRCPASALVLGALALLASLATLEDYGVLGDSYAQCPLADATLRYLAGDSDAFETLGTYSDRFYGAAFEVPLLLAEATSTAAKRRLHG